MWLEDWWEKYDKSIACNRCSERTNHYEFHCWYCSCGDFDIYPQCFQKGLHCLEDHHLLCEFSETTCGEKYYTKVDESTGQRDIISL